jgi:hypothetical protein
MINSVRSTVMAVANKNNFGYITPEDFNLYAKQAQLDLFEDYIFKYNLWVTKQNSRTSNSGYADIVKKLDLIIDKFSKIANLAHTTNSDFTMPADYYYLNTIRYNNKEVGKVSGEKILYLLSSNLTAPNIYNPAYVLNGQTITVYPTTITTGVSSQYLRLPKDPKWTYVNIVAGEPVFDQSNGDYQDFELPLQDEPSLVNKILEYAGMSIREPEVVNLGAALEGKEQQLEG